jgi:hypothetical protein
MQPSLHPFPDSFHFAKLTVYPLNNNSLSPLFLVLAITTLASVSITLTLRSISQFFINVTEYLRKQLKGRSISFASQFHRFQSVAAWSIVAGLMVRQSTMVEGHGGP